MIETPLVTIEKVSYALGDGSKDLFALAKEASEPLKGGDFGGVIVATFSNPERFPALSVRLVSALGLPASTPAFDLQLACSAYPYAVYLAGRLSADSGKRVLVVNGDVQSRLVNPDDHATGHIFSDAVTASVIFSDANSAERSRFDFYSKSDEALRCPSEGPIFMDGMAVFTFVATDVRAFLKDFISASSTFDFDSRLRLSYFIPHQANPYMVRQLAKALELEKELVTLDESLLNPGSCSIPLTLARSGKKGRALIAGFGAGYSAAAAIVNLV